MGGPRSLPFLVAGLPVRLDKITETVARLHLSRATCLARQTQQTCVPDATAQRRRRPTTASCTTGRRLSSKFARIVTSSRASKPLEVHRVLWLNVYIFHQLWDEEFMY